MLSSTMLMSLGYKSNYLKLIIGPMFSSKSSSLLAEINRYKYITDKILVINSILDKQRNADMDIKNTPINVSSFFILLFSE